MSLKDRITLNILEHCKNNNITMKELAKKLNYGLPKIKRMLNINKKTRRFTVDDLDNICHALKVKPKLIINYKKKAR